MNNTIWKPNNLMQIKNTLIALVGAITLLSLSIVIPLVLMKPSYNFILANEWFGFIQVVPSIFMVITLVLFAVSVYISWRLFAKRSFIAWLGATILMAMVIVSMFFLV